MTDINFTSSHIFWLNTLRGTTTPLTEVTLDFSAQTTNFNP